MSDVHSDELYLAAASWKELVDYSYRFTYGYKMRLNEIFLSQPRIFHISQVFST